MVIFQDESMVAWVFLVGLLILLNARRQREGVQLFFLVPLALIAYYYLRLIPQPDPPLEYSRPLQSIFRPAFASVLTLLGLYLTRDLVAQGVDAALRRLRKAVSVEWILRKVHRQHDPHA